jgi:iron complex outermembrane receptor protein
VLSNQGNGTVTNTDGEFSFANLSKGNYELTVRYVGFKPYQKHIGLFKDMVLDVVMETTSIMAEEVIVQSTRAGENTPTTYTVVKKEALEENNLGQDLPYLLALEPSVVTSSDAGAGVGYTSMWIRGSNIQRINVTVNGIPINDPESHGVFWVNMPDFSSSTQSVQIQRGVGTSTNGGGAFGATINMETNQLNKKAFAEVNSSAGSFNTLKNNVRFGTGLINKHWAFEGRLSQISSDGYIDRASSDLKSYFAQGGYYSENTNVKAVIFSGKEKTYQSWNGVDQWTIDNYGRTFNSCGIVFGKNENGETDSWNFDNIAKYYDNETDNYQQDHYQLHLSQRLSDNLYFTGAMHYTYGRGYYEQYYQDANLAGYPMGVQLFGRDTARNEEGALEYFYHDTVNYSDMIVRRWLDNHFYGGVYNLRYKQKAIQITLGGAWNKYNNARHYGEVIWSQFASGSDIRDTFYDNTSNKTDFNNYLKVEASPFENINIFADFQLRKVNYLGSGTDKGGSKVDINADYLFFNPKLGVSVNLPEIGQVYASWAVANREPIRNDFTDAPEGITPKPEKLNDFEAGLRKQDKNYFYQANAYFMHYTNQLVLTGQLDDVGSPIRANVGESSRMGLELNGGISIVQKINIRANAALSTTSTDYKRIESDKVTTYNDVQLSFSPSVVSGGELEFIPVKDASIALIGKYVSKQYLDLTENEDRKLDAHFISNLRLQYSLKPGFMQAIDFTLLVNNLFNTEYFANGYTWSDIPYYYPQAGINFLAGVSLKF